jgi:hypothetical protein
MRFTGLILLTLLATSTAAWLSAEQAPETFLQTIQRALLYDNTLKTEEVQIEANRGSWDVLVPGKRQGLFMTFPVEPKFEFADANFHYYRGQEEGGDQRAYDLSIYDNPLKAGFEYAQTAADLSPRSNSHAEAEHRLAKSRKAAAQKVIEGFYKLRERGYDVTLESQGFHEYTGPLIYTTGDWRVKMRKTADGTSRESLVRVVVGVEKIYVIEVTAKNLFPERNPWYGSDLFQPSTFVNSIQLFGHTTK